MGKLFGTNGVRGIFPKDFSLKLVYDLTSSIAAYLDDGPILVGYDGRNSSSIIARTVCATLNYYGIDCKNAGLVPTPCLEFATKKLGYTGGIMVTASHNPPEYNGIKLCGKDGVEISREDENIIENIYFNQKWLKQKSIGITTEEQDAISIYINSIISQLNHNKIKSKKFTVVLDLGNGAQAVTAPNFCKTLNCNVITVNENIDGKFPGRGSEPTPENLLDLSKTVIENNADFGIAFDGDGDRSIFCDNDGKILSGDKSALLLAKYILINNPNSIIATCLNSGTAIENIAQQAQSSVIRTKVGSVEVSRRMITTNAVLGFEENGGFMFGKHNQVRDGVMTLGLMLDLLASSDSSITDLVSQLPDSFTTKDKIPSSPQQTELLISKLKQEYPESDTTDGIKIIFSPREWIMIRPSGTEPIIRIYAEAESQDKLNTIMAHHTKKINSIISE